MGARSRSDTAFIAILASVAGIAILWAALAWLPSPIASWETVAKPRSFALQPVGASDSIPESAGSLGVRASQIARARCWPTSTSAVTR